MPRPPALPPATPRTTTKLLLARGGDPFVHTRAIVESARVSVAQLLAFLPPQQGELRARFQNTLDVLDATLPAIPAGVGPATTLPTTGSVGWGEPIVVAGSPMGHHPVNPDPNAEPVYGFQVALNGTSRYLWEASDAMRQGAQTWGMQRIVQAAAVAHAASAVDHLAAMFTAAVWDFERPAMPALPAKGGRIELRAAPRAAPMTTWARYARVMFLTDRVELTTASGRQVIGEQQAIAYLMHVVPPSPTAALMPYDPAEPYGPVPLYDELGVVHFCNAAGRSIGAIAVADWLAQPELTVAQGATMQTADALRAYDRLVWALDASGIAAGAATLRVPIRRGVQHPPPEDPTTLNPPQRGRHNALADAHPPTLAAHVVRPGPHLLPYQGWATDPARALLRRQRRHRVRQIDMGPSSIVTEVLRAAYPAALWAGALCTAYLLEREWWVRLLVLIAVAAVAEPWITWLVRWFADRDMRRMVAVYQPGAAPGHTRAFQANAKLMYDGANIGVRTGSRHEAWIAASSDNDLGVVALHRLMQGDRTWGIALIDRLGRWRLVLPADAWAPDGDLTGLAGFARAADLELGETFAEPPVVREDLTIEDSTFARARSRGPLTRGMVIASSHSIAAFVVTLPGSTTATIYTLGITAIALVPVFLRWAWTSWMASSTNST